MRFRDNKKEGSDRHACPATIKSMYFPLRMRVTRAIEGACSGFPRAALILGCPLVHTVVLLIIVIIQPPTRQLLCCSKVAVLLHTAVSMIRESSKYGHYTGNRRNPAHRHYGLFSFGPSDITGTIAGNRHYYTDTKERLLLEGMFRGR